MLRELNTDPVYPLDQFRLTVLQAHSSYRIAGLNLLTAIIIYWNTAHLGQAIDDRRSDGLDVSPELLAHISPLGWAHILLTGEYLWPMGEKA